MSRIRIVTPAQDSREDQWSDPIAILCFSHLRWNFVRQRPQHLMSRFARSRSVYFVEEPIFVAEGHSPWLAVASEGGVTILTPHLPHGLPGGFGPQVNTLIQELLEAFRQDHHDLHNAIVWYYTPMALHALPTSIEPALVIFDVMDELANFRFAPRELVTLDTEIMAQADLVFTGGPSLYRGRVDRHAHVHCFASGVDQAHFATSPTKVPVDLREITGPVIGFYGVLDERIDFPLLNDIAILRPDWTIVLIGPMAKITDTDLAHQPNITYLGMRSYAELPHYLARFDCAILPFARNEATAFISPTKTLEYLAGGKPVVSTSITDVVELYGEVVAIADTAVEFVHAIEAGWEESDAAAHTRAETTAEILRHYDWDSIAHRMDQLMRERQAQLLDLASSRDQRELSAVLPGYAGRERVSSEVTHR